jgi:thiamine-phosphate pyrophosphorylase
MAQSCLFYYITDRRAFPGDEVAQRRRLLQKISEAARAGVNYIQLREKDLSTRDLESLSREAVKIIRETRLTTDNRQLATALLINHRTDVAVATEADGVHLRSDDISPQEVKVLWEDRTPGQRGASTPAGQLPAKPPTFAVSCHSPAEVAQAAAGGATFAVFGPVFEKGSTQPTGLALLRQACQATIPVLALGGVTLANARFCLEAGAAGIAAIRIFQENDIASIVNQLRRV